MTIVAHGPDLIVCSFHSTSGSGTVDGRTYYWDFSDRFGPLFTDANGRELKVQPGVRTKHWKAFDAWHKELRREVQDMRPPYPPLPQNGEPT